MVYKLIVSERADELIESLFSYLLVRLDSSQAAVHFLDELDGLYDRLLENPMQFPKSSDGLLKSRGYREALFSSMQYRLVFRVESKMVYIVGVFHDLENYQEKVEE